MLSIDCHAVKPSTLPKLWLPECVLFARPLLSKRDLKWLKAGVYLEGVPCNKRAINSVDEVKEKGQTRILALCKNFGVGEYYPQFWLEQLNFVTILQLFVMMNIYVMFSHDETGFTEGVS